MDKDYVCISTNGTIKGPSTLVASLDRICKYACIPHTRFHALRHIYATILKNSEINIKAISNYMGYSKPTFTEYIYCKRR